MPVQYSTDCRRCGERVAVTLAFERVHNQHDGVRVRCDCGATNFIPHDDKHDPKSAGEVA